MIRVSQAEAFRLNQDYGVKFGENGLIAPHSHHKNHYYLTESEYNMRSLYEFSKNDKVKAILNKMDAKKRHYNKKKKVN